MKPIYKKIFYVLQLLIGLVLQAVWGWYLWASAFLNLPDWIWWIGSGVGALCVANGLSLLQPKTRRLDFWVFLLLCLFMPIYGAMGCLLLVIYRIWRRNDAHLAEEFVDYVQSQEHEEDNTRFESGSAEEIIFQELSIQSYTDIMRGSNALLKKALIGKILQEWTPNAVSLLRLALKDEVYEIRSYASTALTTIEDRMNRAIQDARRSAQTAPEDLGRKLKLARSYITYAESGLLDASSSVHYAGIAKDILMGITDHISPEEDFYVEHLALQGQAARLTHDEDTQLSAYKSILEKHPQHQETLGHLCEYYFKQRNFTALSNCCTQFLAVTQTEHPLVEPARLWSPQTITEPRP